MKEKTFKPMKAPQQKGSFDREEDADFNFSDLNYPLLASYKLDGIRCEFKKGEILSCSLKQIQNKQLREKFEPIRKFCEDNNLADGEIYNHDLPFSLISSCVMTQDHNDKKAIKAWEEKCEEHGIEMTREEAVEGMQYWCFDGVQNDNFDEGFGQRYNNYV